MCAQLNTWNLVNTSTCAKPCSSLQKKTQLTIRRKLGWLPTPPGWQLHHLRPEASLWWAANIALSGKIYLAPQFQGFILIHIGRLGRGVLGTSTWESTSPMGRRWPSSWSRAKPAILSCFMRANYTRFFRQAEHKKIKSIYMRLKSLTKNEHFVLMKSTLLVVKLNYLF